MNLFFIMSFLESTSTIDTEVQIEKEIDGFGDKPCTDCGYYHGDDIDHTGEGDLSEKENDYYRDVDDEDIEDTTSIEGNLTEEEMPEEEEEDQSYEPRGYFEPCKYYYGDDYNDAEDNPTEEEKKKMNDDDDDDVPSLELSKGIMLSFTRRVKSDLPNGYVSGEKLEIRFKYQKEVTNILEHLLKGFLLNHKPYFKEIYTSIRDHEKADPEWYEKDDVVELTEEISKKYVNVRCCKYADVKGCCPLGDDEDEQ